MILLPLTSLMSGGRLTSLSVMLEARSGFVSGYVSMLEGNVSQ